LAAASQVCTEPYGAGGPARAVGDADTATCSLLVGLTLAQGHDQADACDDQVGDIQADELGATEGAGEAEEEQQRAIAPAKVRVGQLLDHFLFLDVVDHHRRLALLGSAVAAPDASMDAPYDVAHRWRRQVLLFVRLADDNPAARDRSCLDPGTPPTPRTRPTQPGQSGMW